MRIHKSSMAHSRDITKCTLLFIQMHVACESCTHQISITLIQVQTLIYYIVEKFGWGKFGELTHFEYLVKESLTN